MICNRKNTALPMKYAHQKKPLELIASLQEIQGVKQNHKEQWATECGKFYRLNDMVLHQINDMKRGETL